MSVELTASGSCGECILRTRATNLDCIRCATERALVQGSSASTRAPTGRIGLAPIALLVTSAACWGSAFQFTEVALTELAPLTVTFLRCLIGALVIGVALALQQRGSADASREVPGSIPTRRGGAWRSLLVGGVCTGIAYATIALGQVGATSTATGVILGTVPVWTAAFVLVAARGTSSERRPSRRLGVALLLGTAAAGFPALADPSAAPMWAVVLLALAALSHGGSMAVIQPAVERFGPLRSTIGVNVISALVVTPWVVSHPPTSMPGMTAVAAVLVLGLLPTGLAYVTFFEVSRRLGARRAALAVYLIPAVALLVGWVSDPALVTVATLAGAACGVGAVVVGVTGAPRARRVRSGPASRPARTRRPSPG